MVTMVGQAKKTRRRLAVAVVAAAVGRMGIRTGTGT